MRSDDTMDLSSAVAPTICDAFCAPRFILPLVLSNLLSDELWRLAARVAARAEKEQAADAPHRAPPAIRAIQHQINKHFEHLPPTRVRDMIGELDLAFEAERLGRDRIDAFRDTVAGFMTMRAQTGSLPQDAARAIVDGLRDGRFPAYSYQTFDVVRARRRLLGARSGAPMGLTSCFDEVAMFCALAMALPPGSVDAVIILASPTHYTAFGWSAQGAWWLTQKHALQSQAEWSAMISDDFAGDAQAAFDSRLADFDRMISVSGVFDMRTGTSDLPPDHLDLFVGKMDDFFGARLRQLDEGLARERKQEPESALAKSFRALLGAASLDAARDEILSSTEPDLQSVRYSWRSLDVDDPAPYLAAARRGPLTRKRAAALRSAQDAIDLVASIEGRDSIFGENNRIAMPDETILFGAGAPHDRALLLHVLLEHVAARGEARIEVETFVTEQAAIVCSEGRCTDVSTMTACARPSGAPTLSSGRAA